MIFFLISTVIIILLFLSIFCDTEDSLMRNHNNEKPSDRNNAKIMSGELMVTGDDEAHIELHKDPESIMAILHGHSEITPCHPHHHDEIKSYKCNFHHKHCMVIKWKVANSRKIVWEVIF